MDIQWNWHFGGHRRMLTITNCQPGDTGNYAVVVSNAMGSVTSSNAVLNLSMLQRAG